MSDTYTCAACGETFPKGWSDEEADAERKRDFPWLRDEDAVVVCDDCYRSIYDEAEEAGYKWGDDQINTAIAAVESAHPYPDGLVR